MTASGSVSAATRAEATGSSGVLLGEPRAWRIATLFVVPYVLLGMAWLGSNPPVGAPDEDAHLVGALGIARLDIGVPFAGPVDLTRPAAARNDSNTRVVTIASRLSPAGYGCFGFRPEVTADCQPPPPVDAGDIQMGTDVGAYPPFPYLPVGIAASAAATPPQAITLGRAVILAETALLLWLAVLVLPPVQFYALFLNAKRYAVGLASEPKWFLPAARWSPPLGWPPWLVLGFAACLAMLLGWVQLARTSPRMTDPDLSPTPLPPVDATAVGSP